MLIGAACCRSLQDGADCCRLLQGSAGWCKLSQVGLYWCRIVHVLLLVGAGCYSLARHGEG